MAKKPNKFMEKREDATSRIVTAAAELFAEYGYAATTMQMVAKRANVVPSGIYYYFAGKQELLMAVSNQLCDEITQAFDRGMELLPEGADLDKVVDFSIDTLLENTSKVRLVVMLLLQKNLPEECRERLRDVELRFVSNLTGVFHNPEIVQEATVTAFHIFAGLFLISIDRNESFMELYRPRVKQELMDLLEADTLL